MVEGQNVWGFTPGGEAVILYTLVNSRGERVRLSNIGAGIISVEVAGSDGHLADVALGYEDFHSYFNDGAAMGKTVGRYANRIGGGRFTLDHTEYRTALTGPGITLHGGPDNFSGRLWESRVEDDAVVFSLVSPHGDQGFPGELGVEVHYRWSDVGELEMTLMAACSAPTVVNLTNHGYFNLAGHDSGSVLDHTLKINASTFLDTDRNQVPTGKLVPVDGTPMDFREGKPLGRDIGADYLPLEIGAGYDHCWPVDGYAAGKLVSAAVLYDPFSGRRMEILTDQPSVQVYTGNFLQGGPTAKGGAHYANRGGVAIECQDYPDAPNHYVFPSTVLRPGQTYCRRIIYKFGAERPTT